MEKIEVVDSEEQVVHALVHFVEEKSKAAIAERDRFVIGLSGGSACTFFCKGLPMITSDWTKWKFIFCDERIVPFDDAECTFSVYKNQLFSKIPLTDENFVVIDPSLSAKDAAEDYERKLKALYPDVVGLPKFDFLLVGAGPDGHTCSLFPGHPLLDVTDRWVTSIEDSPKPPPCRVTLTYPIINNALCAAFAFAGAGKADLVKRLLKDKEDLPANRVKPLELLWILDKSAASQL
ncbi:hypothetical protein DAPPUDRAFT_302585 [Daphnia pulex]|uniref:6-phosphogluconolactonase n=2 Tax=Daphnia TaxID=6668 RepID=E9GDE3_DAPPU|nr:hypothetical protein DAPPUDRAFT_302585 [Daphnia pulex]|eukprot:EFX82067.1 hypothetical protein DAPPUDRAFT_302585 [Daphnia pulex]